MEHFSYWFLVTKRAWKQAWADVTEATGIGKFLVMWAVLALLLSFATQGWNLGSLKEWAQEWLPVSLVVAVVLFFLWTVIRVPAKLHAELVSALEQERSKNSRLHVEVARRRHSVTFAEPAGENAMVVFDAFREWRQEAGEPAPLFLVSYAGHPSPFVLTFLQWAVKGCNIGNGNLHNLGIPGEEIENLETSLEQQNGQDLVIFHAASDAGGALRLFDALSSKLLWMVRRYNMPAAPRPYPKNTIWIYFRKEARWASEHWDEQIASRLGGGN